MACLGYGEFGGLGLGYGEFGGALLWQVWRGFALAGLNAGASKNYY